MLRTTFTPRSLANLELWLDASVQSSVTLNGSTVSSWADLSGNGRDALQSTASQQPTYSATQNGRRVVSFDGSAQSLRGAWPLTITGQTVFAVLNTTNLPVFSSGYGRVFTQTTTQSGTATGTANLDYTITGHYIPVLRNANTSAIGSWNASGFRASISPSYSSWNVISSTYSGSTISNSLNNGTATTYNGSAINTAFHAFGIGGYPGAQVGANDGFFGGAIGEVVVFSRGLSSREMSAIATYLNRKWATP